MLFVVVIWTVTQLFDFSLSLDAVARDNKLMPYLDKIKGLDIGDRIQIDNEVVIIRIL